MLFKDLKSGEVLEIGDTITVRAELRGNKVRLFVQAPRSFKIGKKRHETLQSPKTDSILPDSTGEGPTP